MINSNKLYIWFAASAVLCLAVLSIAPIQSTRKEWKGYQKMFYRIEAKNISDEDVRGKILHSPLKIKQIVVKDLDRVDRCMTCHISIEDPRYMDDEHPIKSHPGDLLKQHTPDKFGCTICHEGQGRATTVKAAHGESRWWQWPLLPMDYVYGTCGKCHTTAEVPYRLFGQGNKLIGELGCIGCHIVEGKGGTIGPELTGVGSRRNADWLYNHFKNPQEANPGSVMPKYDLTDAEIKSLVMLMYGLNENPIPYRYRTFKERAKFNKPPSYPNKIEAGRASYQKYGCAGCHGRDGEGGVKNPNAQGNLVPALMYVKEGYTLQELKEYILKGVIPQKANPELPGPPLFMPSWKGKISDQELNNLAEYLFSLYPKEEEIW